MEGTDVRASRTFRDHHYFLMLLAVNVIVGRIAMAHYAEDFALLRDAISDLGATQTRRGGAPNPVSPYIFGAQLFASAVIMLRFAHYLRREGADAASVDVRLAQLAAVGFLLMPAPHNEPVYHTIHMVGAGFVIFSLWVYGMRYLWRCRLRGMVSGYRVGMTLLQGGVLTYALLFALGSPVKQVAQAAAVASVCLVLTGATVALARSRAREPVSRQDRAVRRRVSTAGSVPGHHGVDAHEAQDRMPDADAGSSPARGRHVVRG